MTSFFSTVCLGSGIDAVARSSIVADAAGFEANDKDEVFDLDESSVGV